MKTAITTVGTSLLENLKVKVLPTLKKATFEEWDSQKESIIEKQGEIKEKISNEPVDKLCAEVQTLLMIKKNYPNLVTYLICTDTILSVMCADAIKPVLEKHGIRVHFEHTREYVVEGLIVEGDRASKTFSEIGFPNLIRVVRNIESRSGADNRPILNISGGYKALIPVMTVMGQLYDMEVAYVYEDGADLINLGKLPINFDFDFGEALAHILSENVQLLDQKPKIKQQLINLNLIYEKRGKISPTLIAELFLDFIKNRSALSQTNLGFFIEYLLFQYYTNDQNSEFINPKKEDLNLYYIKGSTYEFVEENIAGEVKQVGDIDLLLHKKDNNGVVIAEVKSRSLMSNINKSRDYYSEQVKAKIEGYKFRHGKYPEGYLFIVYQPVFFKEKIYYDIAEKNIKEMKRRLIIDYDDQISLYAVGIQIELRSNSTGISYTELLKSGIKSEFFHKLV